MGSILVVDDDPAIHSMYRRVMRPLNRPILKAMEPMEALRIMVEQGVDLIILDQKMPGMTGMEFLKFLRERGKPVPVILVSGYITADLLQQCNQLSVSYIFRKPVSPETLCATAEKILGPEILKSLNDNAENSSAEKVEDLTSEDCDGTDSAPTKAVELPNSEEPVDGKKIEKGSLSKFGEQVLGCISNIGLFVEGTSEEDDIVSDEIVLPPISESPDQTNEELERVLENFFDNHDFSVDPGPEDFVKALKPAAVPENASFRIWVSEDGLKAFIDVKFASNNGKPISENQLRDKLSAMHITFGIRDDEVMKILKDQNHSNNQSISVRNIVLAIGVSPVHGNDGQISYPHLEKSKSEENESNCSDSMERVDYREQHRIINVRAGEQIARITMPTRGIAGISVHGKTIAARDGKPIRMQAGSNVKMSADGLSMYALIDGRLIVKDLYVQVEKVFNVIGDVDMSVGNIHFCGDVIIAGSVLDDFEVEATGNVSVGRNVNAATIICGGNLTVGKGIICRQKGSINATGNVSATFVENSNIQALGNVIISANSMHSAIKSNSVIRIFGKIMGGEIQAKKIIDAGEIGSAMGKMPVLTVGIDIADQIQARRINDKISSRQRQIVEVRQFLARAKKMLSDSSVISAEDKIVIFKLVETYKRLQLEIENLKNEFGQLSTDDNIKGFSDCFIQARDRICRGVDVFFGKKQFEAERDLVHERLCLDPQLLEVVIRPWSEVIIRETVESKTPESILEGEDILGSALVEKGGKPDSTDLFFDL